MADSDFDILETGEPEEDWLVTFADAITLLMSFFILLVSFSKVDIPTYEQVAAGISEEIGNRVTERPIEVMEQEVQNVVNEMQANEVVSIGTDAHGLVIDIESRALFKPGSADIRAEAVLFLTQLAETLEKPKFRTFLFEAEGHTDDQPIRSVQFPSNWELSTARASTVVRFLITQDFNPVRLKASGYADTKPKVPNRTDKGEPIPENMELNRRISVRIYPMSLEERKEILGEEARIAEETRVSMDAAKSTPVDTSLENEPPENKEKISLITSGPSILDYASALIDDITGFFTELLGGDPMPMPTSATPAPSGTTPEQ